MKDIDKVILILSNSNDGDDLELIELKICEMAANGILNKAGKKRLNEIYQQYVS